MASRSRYARKIRRKLSARRVDPMWMWWFA